MVIWNDNTPRNLACSRRVCKAWSRALSSDAIKEAGGLEAVFVVYRRGPPPSVPQFASALGPRTRILDVDDDTWESPIAVLRLASNQCPYLSDLRLFNLLVRVDVANLVAPRIQLSKLLLLDCSEVDDDWIMQLARGSPKLKTLELVRCDEITDAAIEAVARECAELTVLNLGGCEQLTDASLVAIARGCRELRDLNVSACKRLTDASFEALSHGCPALTRLAVDRCWGLTIASIDSVLRGCPGLTNDKIYTSYEQFKVA